MLSTALTITIPTLAVMFGILPNRQEAAAIRIELNQLRTEIVILRTTSIATWLASTNVWPS